MCMDMLASCRTTLRVHWFSYRSHLLFIMPHTTANKEFWQEFIQLYTSSFSPVYCPNTPFPLLVYSLFLRHTSKNNCQTGSFGHVSVMTFANRLKFVRMYCIVYGHSVLSYNTLLCKFVWPCTGPFRNTFTFYTKVKVKFTLEHTTKAERGRGSIALLFLHPWWQMGVGGQCHAPVALLRE